MFNLAARLSLRDDFSSPMRRVTQQMQRADRMTQRFRDSNGRLRDGMGRFASSTNSASRQLHGFTSGASNAVSGVKSLATGLFALAGAYAAVSGAKSIFEQTVGEAMKREVGQVSISAMFKNDMKKAAAYQKMINDMALDSPVLNYSQMADGSKRLLSLTKNSKVLETSWKNIEKLIASDPTKNTSDAIRAVSELASGDIMSMREVFNIPKADLNALKGLKFDKQAAGLEKLLAKLGYTDSYIDKIGNTTFAKLNMVKEQFSNVFAKIGAPSLGVLSTFFDNILTRLNGKDAQRFAAVGARWMKNILNGLTSSVVGIYDWFAAIQNNADFQKETTLFGQVKWVISDIFKKFIEWLNGGGSKQIADTVNTLFQSLSAVIEATTEVLLPVAMKVGSAIGSGIISGFNAAIKDSWMLQILSGDSVGFAKRKVQDLGVKKAIGYIIDKKKGASHASGLSRVPYDGYQATLHKNERVLTNEEAKVYNNGKGGHVTFEGGIHLHGVGGNLEKAADQLMDIIVTKIQLAGGAGA